MPSCGGEPAPARLASPGGVRRLTGACDGRRCTPCCAVTPAGRRAAARLSARRDSRGATPRMGCAGAGRRTAFQATARCTALSSAEAKCQSRSATDRPRVATDRSRTSSTRPSERGVGRGRDQHESVRSRQYRRDAEGEDQAGDRGLRRLETYGRRARQQREERLGVAVGRRVATTAAVSASTMTSSGSLEWDARHVRWTERVRHLTSGLQPSPQRIRLASPARPPRCRGESWPRPGLGPARRRQPRAGPWFRRDRAGRAVRS